MWLALVLCAATATVAEAQSLPRWVTTKPVSNATTQRVVMSGATLAEAHHNAINYLISQTTTAPMDGSYQQSLLEAGGTPVSQHQALVRVAERSAFFRVVNKLETDTMAWVLCEMTTKNVRAFSDSLYAAAPMQAERLMALGVSSREQGDLIGALTFFNRALNELVPVLHKPLPLQDGSGDLVQTLRQHYVGVLDGIEWQWEREMCYMVPGEDLPVGLGAVATCQGHPVPGLMARFELSPEGGTMTSDDMTDSRGRAQTHITKAPADTVGEVRVSFDPACVARTTMADHLFTPELMAHLASPQWVSLPLRGFDPTPTYALAIDAADMSAVGDTLSSIMKRFGYQPVADAEAADLVVSMTYAAQPEGQPTEGKFSMQNLMCELHVTVTDRRTSQVLAQADKQGLRLFVRAATPEDRVRQMALGELNKRIRLQFSAKVKAVKFDKRSVMFNQ